MDKISGYDFLQKLINAIESFTAIKSKENNHYFLYGNLDFIPVFERNMYFGIFSDHELFLRHLRQPLL